MALLRGFRSRRSQRGSAIADFALVSVVLVPLFFGVLQLALIWHVKSTLTSAASQGARYGATYQRSPWEGAERTRAVIGQTFKAGVDDTVSAHSTSVRGQPGLVVEVRAEVPMLAFWGPTITVEVDGHAIKETLP
ncbi:MAG: TadE/TadG family type IV pilus assembly protein [Nocardioidaceae bacterium]